MGWLTLILAGIFEVAWTFFLKESANFTRVQPVIGFLISLILSMVLLAHSLKSIPVSVAYPIWTGIGAVGAVALGIVVFGESASFLKLFFSSLIIWGIVGLKFFS